MFEGKRIRLRSWEKQDVELAHKLYSSYEIQRTLMASIAVPFNQTQEEDIILAKNDPSQRGNFAIIDKATDKAIGNVGYFKVNLSARTATIGIAIADTSYWGQGYGTEAMQLLINFLFNEMNMRKICLNVFSFNERAIKLYEKLGFVVEGRLVEQFYREGKFHDEILMALFRK